MFFLFNIIYIFIYKQIFFILILIIIIFISKFILIYNKITNFNFKSLVL